MNGGGGGSGASSPPGTRNATPGSTPLFRSASPTPPTRGSGPSGSPSSSRVPTALGRTEKDWTGNSVYLWAIANAAYMSVLGPAGFEELGGAILRRSHLRHPAAGSRAGGVGAMADRLLQGVRGRFRRQRASRWPRSTGDSGATASSAARDLSSDFPDLGQSALYCVTEVHSRADIDRLAAALEEVTR